MAKMSTVEQALAAVRQNGNALEKVPENLKTQEVRTRKGDRH
jgi:hypothetical protein